MSAASYLGLIDAAIALAIIPGPDTMLSLRYALRGRNRACSPRSARSCSSRASSRW